MNENWLSSSFKIDHEQFDLLLFPIESNTKFNPARILTLNKQYVLVDEPYYFSLMKLANNLIAQYSRVIIVWDEFYDELPHLKTMDT